MHVHLLTFPALVLLVDMEVTGVLSDEMAPTDSFATDECDEISCWIHCCWAGVKTGVSVEDPEGGSEDDADDVAMLTQ